jgi:hypothetical protein
VIERQSWVAFERWELDRVRPLVLKAQKVRSANSGQNLRSLRWMAVNGLIPARADHFLGRTEDAIRQCTDVLSDIDRAIAGGGVISAPTARQRSELLEIRVPIAEWLSSFYLLGAKPNTDRCIRTLRKAISMGEQEPSGQWQNVAVLYYRLCIALAVSSQLAEAKAAFKEGGDFLKDSGADREGNHGRTKTLAVARPMAESLLQVYEADSKAASRGVDSLSKLFMDSKLGQRIEARDRELLFFAAELLFQRGNLQPAALGKTVDHLLALTKDLRDSADKEITQKYLRRYFFAAEVALEKADAGNPTSELHETLGVVRGILEQ